MTEKGYENWTNEKLRRKENQAWDMAGLARQDRDMKDADRWTKEAQAYRAEQVRRRA
jgi:hypothetical protein